MGLFDMFKKKPQEDPAPEDKIPRSAKAHIATSPEEQAKSRERAERLLPGLINALQASRDNGGGGNISLKETKEQLSNVAAMQLFLKTTPVSRLRTDEIDEMLRFYAASATDAVENDYPTEFKYAIDALVWGVFVGRADISEARYEQMAEIIKQRLNSLELYKTNVLNAVTKDERQIKFNVLTKAQEKYLEEIDKYDKVLNDPENAVELGFVKEKMRDPAFTGTNPVQKMLVDYIQKRSNAVDSEVAVKNQLIAIGSSIKALDHAINLTLVSLLTADIDNSLNLPKRISETKDIIKEKMAESDDYLTDLINASDELNALLTIPYSNPSVERQRIKAVISLEGSIKLRQEEEAEKQRILAELQKKAAEAAANPTNINVVEKPLQTITN